VQEERIGQIRKKINTHPDAGLDAPRHTFLTKAGECTDPFTLQYIAGHDNIKIGCVTYTAREETVENCLRGSGI
jgi:hypothetical protein